MLTLEKSLVFNIGTDNPHKPLEVHGDILIHPNLRIFAIVITMAATTHSLMLPKNQQMRLQQMDTCLFRTALRAQTL